MTKVLGQIKNRTDTEVSTDAIKEYVEAKLKEDEDLAAIYNYMITIANDIVDDDEYKRFKADRLQCWQAACCIANPSPLVLSIMETGQGKSFTILLVAKYMRIAEPEKEVVIMTTTETLLEQFNFAAGRLVKDIKIKFTCDPDYDLSKASAVCIDEADSWVKDNGVRFTGKNLGGFITHSKDIRSFMFTATYSPLLKGMCGQRTDLCVDDFIQTFDTRIQISKPGEQSQQIDFVAFGNSEELTT